MAKKTVVKRKNGLKKAAPGKSTIRSTGRTSAGVNAQNNKAVSRKSAKARPPKGPVWQWSALQTATAIRSGAISSTEVVEAHIARMRDVNPKLNAVVVDLSEEALRGSKAADNARAKQRELGPLHGVPITIKENVDYEGRPNPNGVAAQMNIIAPSDAPVVRNLKKAGAIVIGLTNTPEFSFRGFTENPLHGLTLNPWDPDITCGGSSGGAGAAVAAGIGTIAHGNDIGGSLRWPAHCNGVVTIKPTQGRVPAYNQSAAAERPMLAHLMSAQGPLARSVGDVRMALEVMSQRDPRDPWWALRLWPGRSRKDRSRSRSRSYLPTWTSMLRCTQHSGRRQTISSVPAIASARSRFPISTRSGKRGATSSPMKPRCCRKPPC